MVSIKRNGLKEVGKMSEIARRIDIHKECNAFQRNIEMLMIGKETFVIDLVKSLKKVTGEWRAWKHQVFGMTRSKPYVAAIEQVRELVSWSEETYSNTETLSSMKSTESYRKFTTDTLNKFLHTCRKLNEMRVQFQNQILIPLKDFFNGNAASKYILKLELMLTQWKQLLSPGVVNSGHFSFESVHLLKYAEKQENFYCFYLILRLIPDLCFKAEKCVLLVKCCLDTDNSKAYNRERKFLVNIWIPNQNKLLREKYDANLSQHISENIQVDETKLEELTRLRKAKVKTMLSTSNEAQDISDKITTMKQELQNCENQKNKYENLLTQIKKKKENASIEMRILKQNINRRNKELRDLKWFQLQSDNADTSELGEMKTKLKDDIDTYGRFKSQLKESDEKYNEYELIIIQESNKKVNKEFQIKFSLQNKAKLQSNLSKCCDEVNKLDEEIKMLKTQLQIHFQKLKKLEN